MDRRRTGEWLEKLEAVLAGRKPDYLVIQHLEPDHAGSIGALRSGTRTWSWWPAPRLSRCLPKFYPACPNPTRAVKEGDTLALGRHSLTFVMAPMVHWPEVMVSYESAEKVLFSADGFGTFGAIAKDRLWIEEAGRYYFNIVGKYGAQVQALQKKAAGLDIAAIAPLHGPVLREDLGFYLGKYDQWSRYEPEEKDAVLVAHASIHGNTARAAAMLAEILESRGAKVKSADLCRCDQAEAVTDAFRCGKAVFLSSTYDGGLFPPMEHFLLHLRDKTWRNRTVALVENGSWAPAAACRMRTILEGMRDIALFDEVHTIQGAVKEADRRPWKSWPTSSWPSKATILDRRENGGAALLGEPPRPFLCPSRGFYTTAVDRRRGPWYNGSNLERRRWAVALGEKKLFLLDMDGTIYLDDDLFSGTVPFLERSGPGAGGTSSSPTTPPGPGGTMYPSSGGWGGGGGGGLPHLRGRPSSPTWRAGRPTGCATPSAPPASGASWRRRASPVTDRLEDEVDCLRHRL